ncbi:DUF411 domain-containing protein [Pseudooctadecabacter sp.]|uniref:DUF411 domain-containing protein n=1 Tax=Pseudooctadecabacter sp. TaxID=1966338 RepID=UPI0035C82886
MKSFLTSLTLAPVGFTAAPAFAQDTPFEVMKTNGCGCCLGWMNHLEDNGFAPTGEDMHGGLLIRQRIDSGVPQAMTSFHTAFVDGYVIEGHVPAADIRRLLSERHDAVGLVVPCMPYGSPCVGPDDNREAYDVFLINDDGSTDDFTSYSEN